jgi:hypothetical protein
MTTGETTLPRLKAPREIGWAVLFALAVQTAGALIWAGAASQRLTELERRTQSVEVLLERTARLEEQTNAMNASLRRIERKLDRLGPGGSPPTLRK